MNGPSAAASFAQLVGRSERFQPSGRIAADGSCRNEGEHGHFRADVESHAQEMSNASADVELAMVAQVKCSGRVSTISHRQERRGEEGWLALASVSMTSENPALKACPDREVAGVWIVTEGDDRVLAFQLGEESSRIKSTAPEIIESDNLQFADTRGLIAQD